MKCGRREAPAVGKHLVKKFKCSSFVTYVAQSCGGRLDHLVEFLKILDIILVQ